MSRKVQFVTDADGNKVAVILPIKEYEEMPEDLQIPNGSAPPAREKSWRRCARRLQMKLYLSDSGIKT